MVPRLTLTLLVLLLAGCASGIGPRLIRSENLDYNNQLARTMDEQLLLNIVRTRYLDTPLFLEMGNVVVQYSIEGHLNVGGDPVVSGPAGTQRLSTGAGVTYGERPTVTYAPLQGEQFARRLLAPIPAETIILLSQSGWPVDLLLMICVQRINGVENAVEAASLAPSDEPRFKLFEDIASRLRKFQRSGELNMSLELSPTNTLPLIRLFPRQVTNPAAFPDAVFIRDALGMDMSRQTFFLRNAGQNEGPHEIAINSRSLSAVMGFMAKGVEVPAKDAEEKIVPMLRGSTGQAVGMLDPAQRYFHVRSSERAPDNASVKVRHRGHWFYLADDDIQSRVAFALLHTLFSLQTATSNGRQPLLTIPTGP